MSAVTRLDVQLPRFARTSWASEAARAVWEPRLDAMKSRAVDTILSAVERGALPLGIIEVSPDGVFDLRVAIEQRGLRYARAERRDLCGVTPLRVASRHGSTAPAEVFLVGDDAAAAADAWSDDDVLERLAGVPDCCHKSHAALAGWREAWWPVGCATAQASEHAADCRPHAAGSLLLHLLEAAGLPFVPCRFDCAEAAARLDGMLAAAPDGVAPFMRAVAAWPVEWSALHGIAEIRTPVMKRISRSDATAEKLVVRCGGAPDSVEAAAQGKTFPFVVAARTSPARPPRLPVAHPTATPRPEPAPAPLIDWSRVARPQTDGYDTRVVLDEIAAGRSAYRSTSRPRLVEGHPFADGRVRFAHVPRQAVMRSATLADAPLDEPNIARAEVFLRRWPEAFEQLAELIDVVHPFHDTTIPPEMAGIHLGSSSGCDFDRLGTLFITVDDPLGAAQALVHEMSHQKLLGLGMGIERTSRFILNRPDELFVSPIRKDKPRPMTAVFHAQYSFIHVTALDLAMLAGETDEQTRDRILMLLLRNAVRMEAGLEVLERHVKTDAAGEVFVGAFLQWTREVLADAQAALEASGYGLVRPE